MKKFVLLMVVACLLSFAGCTNDTGDSATETDPSVGSSFEDTAQTEPVTNPGIDPGTDPETAAETISETAPETILETTPETAGETVAETAPEGKYETLQNPVVDSANDPWVVEHDGHYYYCRSFWYFAYGIIVTEIPSPHALTNEGGEVVYIAPENTAYSAEYWAPELHYINGEWYIYVAADDGNNETHRMYVLKGTSQDPTDPFEMVGQITDPSNKWAIDGTVLQLKDELYFVWSGWEGDTNVAQNIYIAHMSDPCTIDSERVLLSAPTYSWERVVEPHVNEGISALYHGDDAFLVYSASGSWTDDYCLGLLTLTGEDPLNPASWEKSPEAVFSKRAGVAYGPGHPCFVTAPDGSIWMLYHANLTSGSGWEGRSGWIAPVTFAENGTPHFGQPENQIRFPLPAEPAS